MRIFVTGATGFIGRKLVERLEKDEHEVTCLVRKDSNVKHLRQLDVNLIVGDITDFDNLEKVFRKNEPEIVFHCAAKVMGNDQKELFANNVKGTENICKISFLCGIKRLVYLSSVAVVFDRTVDIITDDLRYNAVNKYGESKIEAERLVKGYRSRGLVSAIIRPAIVYGEDEPHMLNKFLGKVAKHRFFLPDLPAIYISSNLVYVDNVIDVLEIAMYKQEAIEGTFIVADEETITMKRIFEILYDEMDGTKPKMLPRWVSNIVGKIPFYRRIEENFSKNKVHDISRIKNFLEYVPKIKTEEGLRRTVRYWKKCKLG